MAFLKDFVKKGLNKSELLSLGEQKKEAIK
jgi:hypothetical protein